MKLVECDSYKSLLRQVERDHAREPDRGWREKLDWIVARVHHYAEKTGLDAVELLTAWERRRSYWWVNYYQEANQPSIDGDHLIRVIREIRG